MAVFFLVRHALCDMVGRFIAGRGSDIHLNEAGAAQAQSLADRLAHLPIDRVITSPMDRAVETAAPISRRLKVPCLSNVQFNEIDFGEWTGRSLDSLDQEEAWRKFNAMRSLIRIPGGEWMVEVQRRVVNELERLYREKPRSHTVVVSHGDVIKAAIAYYAGIPLDLFHRIEVSPASISVIRLSSGGPEIGLING